MRDGRNWKRCSAVSESMRAPWRNDEWIARTEREIDAALQAVDRPRTGPLESFKSWGRACIRVAPTADGPVWIKHAYRLPPGEDVVMATLATRWADRLPTLVTTFPGAIAMDPLPGQELTPAHPAEVWIHVAQCLGEMLATEREHVAAWLDAGVRDRRPEAWADTLDAFLSSPVAQATSPDIRTRIDTVRDELIDDYAALFGDVATLVPQDSGCCNIHVGDRVVFYDWADVIIGHPFFSCDRLLDQTPRAIHGDVIDACAGAFGVRTDDFVAIRRFNVLHEAIRYHDELAYLDPEDPIATNLANAARSQLEVAITHWQPRD